MFICSDFIGELQLSRKFKREFLFHPKVLAAVMALDVGFEDIENLRGLFSFQRNS